MKIRFTLLYPVFVAWGLSLSAPVLAQDWIVKFLPGDSLWKLCIEYSNKRGCWIELGKYNNIANDRAIRPGEEIRFPRAWLTTVPIVGRVEGVSGDVLHQENSHSAGIPVVAGQTLLLGSRIVSRQGTAKN